MKKVEQRQLALLLECLAEELTDKEDVVDASVAKTNVVQIDTKNNNLHKLQETPDMPTMSTIQPIPSQTLSNKDEEKEKESNQENSKFNKPQPISSAPQTDTAPVKALFSFGSTNTTSVPLTVTTQPIFSIASSTSTTVIASSASNSLISTNTPQSNFTISPLKPAIQPTNNSSFLFGNISNKESLAKPLISSPTNTFTTTGINFNTGSSKEPQSTLISEQKNIGTNSFATPAVFEQFNQAIVKPILSTTITSAILTPTIAATTTGFSFTPNNTFNIQNTSTVSVFGNLTTTASVPKTDLITTTASATTTSAFNIPTTSAKSFENFSSPNKMPSYTQTSAQPVALSSVSTTKSPVCNTTSSSFFNTPQNTTSVFGQTPIFGQSANVNNNNTLNVNQTTGGFSFKSPQTQQASTQQQQPTTSIGGSGGFSFTAITNAPQVSSSDSGKTSVFSRLGPVSTISNTTTAVVSPSKNLFTFSNVSQPNTVTTTASGFGNISNVSNISQTSSIFGGNTSLNNTTQNTAIFGNNNLFSNQNTPSIFGQQIPNNNKVTSTENKSTFSFSSSLVNPQTTTNITNPTFSTNNNNNTSSPFTFGQTSNLNNKPFSFGGDPNANVTNQQTNQSSLPKFNFSTGSNSVFGGNNNTNNNSAPIFGTSTPSNSGAFNFTGNNNNNTNNTVFGSGSTGGSTASPGGAFNFTAPVVPQTSGLAFNIGTGGSQSQNRRPIRQATRRLNK